MLEAQYKCFAYLIAYRAHFFLCSGYTKAQLCGLLATCFQKYAFNISQIRAMDLAYTQNHIELKVVGLANRHISTACYLSSVRYEPEFIRSKSSRFLFFISLVSIMKIIARKFQIYESSQAESVDWMFRLGTRKVIPKVKLII